MSRARCNSPSAPGMQRTCPAGPPTASCPGDATREAGLEAPDCPVVNPNPRDEGAPLLCGLQSQDIESTRGFRPAGSREWLLIAALEGRGRAQAGESSAR